MPRQKRGSLYGIDRQKSDLADAWKILRIHKAVQGRKGDEASAGELPIVATGMMILERSEPMDHGSDFVQLYYYLSWVDV